MESLPEGNHDLGGLEKITSRLFGFDLYVTPGLRHRFTDDIHEGLASRLIAQTVRGMQVFLDVGAHFGYFDILVGLSNPRCRVLAFEPNAVSAEILRRNLRLHSLNADAVDLDDAIASIQDGPILIRIDAGGHESQVLERLRRLIDTHEDVRLILTFEPRSLEAAGTAPGALLAQLGALGFATHFVLASEGRYAKYDAEDGWERYMGVETKRELFCVRTGLSLSLCVFSHSEQLCEAGRSLMDLVDSMIRRYGTLFTVVLPSDGPLRHALEELGASTMTAGYHWWCSEMATAGESAAEDLMLASYEAVDSLLQALSNLSPDVIVTNNLAIPWGAIAAMRLDRPHIWWIEGSCALDSGLHCHYPRERTSRIVEESSNVVVVRPAAAGHELERARDGTHMFDLCHQHKDDRNPHSPELIRLMLRWQLALQAKYRDRLQETDRMRVELAECTAQLTNAYASTWWRIGTPLRTARRQTDLLLRSVRCGRVRRLVGNALRLVAPGLMAWRARRLAGPQFGVRQMEDRSDPLLQAAESKHLEYRPLISVLVPVYNTDSRYLRLAVDSVLTQSYPEWELILCDDGSTRTETLAALEEISHLDPRVQVKHLKVNSGIATATNAALAEARGDYVAMLDHDDELLPEALLEVVGVLNCDRTLDVVYTDQGQIEPDGTMAQAFHKPDWSPQMFHGVMYVGHLLVVRRSLAEAAGGFDPVFDNVQDFEFMLRVSEKTERIAHVAKILYRWRRIPGSVALHGDEKKDIEPLQAMAVNSHFARCGIEAIAESNPRHAHRLLIAPRPRATYPLVSVVVRGSGVETHLCRSCEQIRSVGSYPNREIVVAGGCIPSDVQERLRHMGVVLEAPGKLGAEAFLAGLEQARGEVIVSVRGDLEVQTADYLEHLLFNCELQGVGCVTPLVVGSDGTVSSAGLIIGGTDMVVPAMRGWKPEIDGYAGSLSCVREVSVVSPQCFAVTRRVLGRLAGPSSYFASDYYQAVDLSMRAIAAGLRNLCTPRVLVRHLGPEPPEGQCDTLDRLLLADAWEPLIKKGDSFYNPGLDQIAPGYRA